MRFWFSISAASTTVPPSNSMPGTSIPGAIFAGNIATATSPAFHRKAGFCSTTPNSTIWWRTKADSGSGLATVRGSGAMAELSQAAAQAFVHTRLERIEAGYDAAHFLSMIATAEFFSFLFAYLGVAALVIFRGGVECAPDGGQFAGWELTGATGLSRMKAMAKHRIHSIEFKRQIAQDFIAGETLHALAGRHDVSRNLIRIWVRKFEAGAFDDEARAADLLQDYGAKIAALERMVGRQALEIEFLKGALKSAPRPRSASTSVITGPVVSPSPKDAG